MKSKKAKKRSLRETDMKLDDKIKDRKIVYLFRQDREIAFELALLYLIQGKRRVAREKILDSSKRACYWLKKAGIDVPGFLKDLSPEGQLLQIEKILVLAKVNIPA